MRAALKFHCLGSAREEAGRTIRQNASAIFVDALNVQ